MANFPGFIGETYTGRGIAADAERAINLYLERIESPTGSSKTEWILVSKPGLSNFATLAAPTPPPVPHGTIVSATLKWLSTHIQGTGYSAIAATTTGLAWGANPGGYIGPWQMFDSSAWTNRTDSAVLSSPTISSVYNEVVTFYLQGTILGAANPPDQLELYEVWIEATYTDGSTWRMVPTQYDLTNVGQPGGVNNPALAMDGNTSTFTEIYDQTFGPFSGTSVAVQYTGFVASSLITPGSTPPAINSFVATPKSVAGSLPTLSWNVSNATSVSIDHSVGSVSPTAGSVAVNPSVTTTYTLTATNAAGMSVTSQATVTVLPVPVITSFASSPGSIVLGSSATLSWSVTGASSISLDNGIGTVSGTSISVSPSVTTTYNLTATNAAGSATQAVTVLVAAPVISSFTASPISITSGGSATLAWTVQGASSLSIDHGVGAVTGTSVSVSPTVTTTYTLTATNATGAVTATATLTVGAAPTPPAITSFASSPMSISSGSNATLSWSVSGATSLSISGIGTVTGSSVSVSPTTTTTYVLTATNSAGSVTASTTVTVTVAAPTISSFTASPSSIASGASSTLAWTTANATSLSISGIGTVTGSSISVSPTVTTTYTLTATNSAGSSTRSVTVNVAAPVIASLTASPASIALGAATTLAWSVTGATSLSIDNGVGIVTGSSVSVSPTTTTTYVLTATNAAGSTTRSVTVTVVAPPTISSFTASPASITSGGSSTLAWSVTGAPTLSIAGIGTVTGSSKSVSPTATTTYTLTATNAAGSVTKTVTVTVVAAAAISSFTASPASITSGSSSTLAWSVSGAASLSISGIGTVTGTSRSVSPTVTTTYVLTATNSLGSSVTASATVTVTTSGGGSSVASQIYADMTVNEEAPDGVPSSYDFAHGAVIEQGVPPPSGANAVEFWGGVYIGANGNPATNTRVNVRNCQFYWLDNAGTWHNINGGTGAGSTNSFDGGYYSEDFTVDYGATLNFRTESDGTLSFNTTYNGSQKNVAHFYTPYPRVAINPSTIVGIVCVFEGRLIVDNPALPNDTATANYVGGVGCDYYPATTGSGIEQNPGVGGGRMKIFSTNWRSF